MHTLTVYITSSISPSLCQVMFSPGQVMDIFDSESDSDSEDDLLSSRMHTIVSTYSKYIVTCCMVKTNGISASYSTTPVRAEEGH